MNVAWWENLKMFTIVLQRLHLRNEVHSPCTTKKKLKNDEISMLLIKFLPIVLLLWFYNKSCWCRLNEIARRKVDGVDTVSLAQVEWCYTRKKQCFFVTKKKKNSNGVVIIFFTIVKRDKIRQEWHCCHLFATKRKGRRRRKGIYLQTSTSTTTLKLLLLGHS